MLIRLTHATVENAGAKAAVLGKLAAADFPVPPGFVIPLDAYVAATASLELSDVLAEHASAAPADHGRALADHGRAELAERGRAEFAERGRAELAERGSAELAERGRAELADHGSRVLADHGSDEVRRLVRAQPFPAELLTELAEALTELGDAPVAVRSSATTEDTADASAAGQHDTYLGVQGLAAVADRVQACWSSLWTHRAITYRQTHHAPQSRTDGDRSTERGPAMAVIVQRQVDAEVAGVLFSSGRDSVVEASWGLGESVVQGLVTPDLFTVSDDGQMEHQLGSKQTRIDRDADGTTTITTEVPPHHRERLCLTERQLHELDELGRAVVARLGAPQDIEFALDSTGLWLLQARPITAPLPPVRLPPQADQPTRQTDQPTRQADQPTRQMDQPIGQADQPTMQADGLAGLAGPKVLQGVGGSAGVLSGVARVVEGPGDFGRVGVGEILVCRYTDPSWTPLFGMIGGVVTETGGRLSHAAIVARERRIPAVLGVPSVMKTVRDGQEITIDGSAGTVELAR
ncbi:hypothetical protein GCM10009789_17810 [Kribbella sancticallisti]|uniref:Pyruvate, water dikinase n=1 Tax=Kribbella sancticallisti TaxID=460087 RepID=A0ABN2CUY9_9ACTN